MSQPGNDPINPYQSPLVEAAVVPGTGEASLALVKTLKDFRSQILALGVFWIVIGAIAAGLGVFLATVRPNQDEITIFAAAVLIGFGLVWVVLGALVCAKQIWALYVALVLSYLSLIGNLLRINICGIIFMIVVILQAHRVLAWAKQLTAAGIPLTTKPHDLQVRMAFPPGWTGPG
jgi:hypothetical protein